MDGEWQLATLVFRRQLSESEKILEPRVWFGQNDSQNTWATRKDF